MNLESERIYLRKLEELDAPIRIGATEDVADIVVFLASEEARWIRKPSGKLLTVFGFCGALGK